MKRLFNLLLCVLWIIPLSGQITARADAPLAAGERIFVVSPKLLVYLQPEAKEPVVEEMIPGMVSHILKVQQDRAGATWLYLADNAFAWIPLTVDGKATVVRYSDAALQQLIADSSKTLQADPQNIDAYLARATAFASQHHFDKAVADYDTAIKLAPTDARLYDYRGKMNLETKKFDQVVQDVQQAIKLNRKLPNTLNRLGLGFGGQGGYDQAILYYSQAISLAPNYGLLYSNRAIAYRNLDDSSRATQEFTLAIQHDPLLAIAYTGRADTLKSLNSYDQAFADYNKALEIDPHCGYCYLERGVYYADSNGDEGAALQDFNSAIENDPFDAYSYTNRAVSYIMTGRRDLAFSDFEQAVTLDPNNDFAQYNFASFLAAQNQYDKAIASYTAAIKVGKHYSFSARVYRAQLYLATGKYDEAIADLNIYIESAGAEFLATARLTRGAAYLYKHNYIIALLNYKQAWADAGLVGFAHDYHSQGAGYRVTYAQEYAQEALLKQQIAGDPKNADSVYQLATFYMAVGSWQEAVDSYQAYLTLKPDTLLANFLEQFKTLIASSAPSLGNGLQFPPTPDYGASSASATPANTP